jgi:hypothetical protein
MICNFTCALAIIFFIATIFTNVMAYSNNTITKYKEQLPDELKDLYERITNERWGIYWGGFAIGFILSLMIILYNYIYNKNKLNTSTIVCIVMATMFIVNYLFYTLYPKSNWMLDNIKTPEQTKAWLDLYKNMKTYYHFGLLLGIIAVSFFALAFKC